MSTFYSDPIGGVSAVGDARPADATPTVPTAPALIAVYDTLAAPPRIEEVRSDTPRGLIEALATRTYRLSHEAGGEVPYVVIREVVENFMHAAFDEVVVSILDKGRTIRFSDQGPGIPDKQRAFEPGFSTADEFMKRVIKGVGSGLPVAREYLTFSGGTIEIDDNLGSGTVVTLRVSGASLVASSPVAAGDTFSCPALTLRQKQVLSLVMELGPCGPTVISKELGVGLSTAYRDLEQLASYGLISADESGKRVLTGDGIRCLDALFGQ